MTANSRAVLEAALSLPPGDRIELVESLIHSLDAPEEAALETAWNKEIDRRLAELDSGSAEMLSHEQALRRVREARKA